MEKKRDRKLIAVRTPVYKLIEEWKDKHTKENNFGINMSWSEFFLDIVKHKK